MMQIAREMVSYAAASAVAFACDVGTLAFLVQVLQWHYLVAASVAFTVGAVVAYLLSVRYVFRFRRIADRRVEFAGFAGIGAAGLAVNAGTMYAGVEWLGMHYLAAKALAGGFTFTMNYVVRRLTLFTPPGPLQGGVDVH
jgi:putative flippase GtrA